MISASLITNHRSPRYDRSGTRRCRVRGRPIEVVILKKTSGRGRNWRTEVTVSSRYVCKDFVSKFCFVRKIARSNGVSQDMSASSTDWQETRKFKDASSIIVAKFIYSKRKLRN